MTMGATKNRVDDKRDPDPAHDDIPDILARWENREAERDRARTDKSFLVPRLEIVESDCDFSFNKYTETQQTIDKLQMLYDSLAQEYFALE